MISVQRAALTSAFLVLLGIAIAAQLRLWTLEEAASARARAEVERVLSAGEVLGASLLGGFRAFAINIVWVRLLDHLDHQRFSELPPVYGAIEVLQGASPELYLRLSEQMVLDIPRRLVHRPDDRWTWIERGLAALERARRRFPRNLLLLRQAQYLYYERFHPERSPADRERFLASPRGAGGTVDYGRDPLELARAAGEEAVALPGHPFDIDQGLWAIYRISYGLMGPRGAPALRQGQAQGILARASDLVAHVREAHGRNPLIAAQAQEWQGQLDEEKRALER